MRAFAMSERVNRVKLFRVFSNKIALYINLPYLISIPQMIRHLIFSKSEESVSTTLTQLIFIDHLTQ